jgi:signal transduction histidine kinase
MAVRVGSRPVAFKNPMTLPSNVALALQETNVELKSAKSAAEKANLTKSDFLSNMSHELLDSSSPLPTASQKESIAQILQAGWHLLKLINEVLDLALVESGTLSISPEPASLAEVISACQAMMEPQAQQRGIRMTFPELDIPYFVDADRTREKQVLINLLSNAIKYNREQGRLRSGARSAVRNAFGSASKILARDCLQKR